MRDRGHSRPQKGRLITCNHASPTMVALKYAVALVVVLAHGCDASSLRPPSMSSWMRVRGGAAAESEDGNGSVVELERKALTKEEIMEKLNSIPTFCIVNKDGGVIGMTDAEGGKKSCCWFTDAAEAKAILAAVQKSNPDAGLRLECHGLGGAFTQCNGWETEDGKPSAEAKSPDGDVIELRLQGNHALTKAAGPKLVKMLDDMGIDKGCWQLPLFICDKLQSPKIVPVFLNPRDLAKMWERSGRKKEDLPEDISVMDIRMLVKQMQTDENPWSIFHFVGSVDAVKLAAEIQGLPIPEGLDADEDSDGSEDGAAKSVYDSATEDEDEEEEVMV